MLYSTGIRVGELVNLNISDVNLNQQECIVYGKGAKERRVFLMQSEYRIALCCVLNATQGFRFWQFLGGIIRYSVHRTNLCISLESDDM